MQFISDLHLEMCNRQAFTKIQTNIIQAKGDNKYIGLLGDIGDPTLKKNFNYYNLIANLSKEYEKVFVVAGNHEYYTVGHSDKTIEEVNDEIKKVCKSIGDNVHFLNNDVVEINNGDYNIVVAGTVLWSNIPPEHEDEVRGYINDYRKIKNFTIQRQNELHHQSIEFIDNVIDTFSDKRVVMLTHHAPYNVGTSPPIYEKNNTNCAFASDLSDRIKYPISAWCFGHTHYRSHLTINGVIVASNPRGYGGELQRYGQNIDYGMCIKL